MTEGPRCSAPGASAARLRALPARAWPLEPRNAGHTVGTLAPLPVLYTKFRRGSAGMPVDRGR